MNFDGASKGNPGATGFGVVFRNQQGNILLISVGSMGHTTNNVAKLWGLTRGLQIALEQGFHKLIVEGDSQVVLNLFEENSEWSRSRQNIALLATILWAQNNCDAHTTPAISHPLACETESESDCR
jgi:ribonuclease HI